MWVRISCSLGLLLGLVLTLCLAGCPARYEPYDLTVYLTFPPDQNPTEDLAILEMIVEYSDGTRYTFAQESAGAGSWIIEDVPAVPGSGGVAELRFRGLVPDAADEGNYLERANGTSGPLVLGYTGDIHVYFSRRQSVARIQGELSRRRLGATVVSLPDGGAMVIGGRTSSAVGADAASGMDRLERGEDGHYEFREVLPSFHRIGAVVVRVDEPDAEFADQLLILGGREGSTEDVDIVSSVVGFDPDGETTWSIGEMPIRLADAVATSTDDGVLLSGGTRESAALNNIYLLLDPWTGEVVEAGMAELARRHHGAVALDDGSVLVCGGARDAGTGSTGDCEIWDQGGEAAADMATSRESFALLRLPGDAQNRVVAFGGCRWVEEDLAEVLDTVEIYDPDGDSWSLLPARMNHPRCDFEAVQLPDDRILVCGGFDEDELPVEDCELFDPVMAGFVPLPDGTMTGGLSGYGTAVLDGGMVLLAGGDGAEPTHAYLFNP